MSSLKLNHISKNFGGFIAIDDVNISVSQGEFFSIVGPSGCGKSTLLRIIAGLESPSAGEVILDGKNINILPVQKRKVGIVFQNYALFPHMTVFENVAYGLKVRKMDKDSIRKKVDAVLEKVKIIEKRDLNVSTLSGGEQQRVSLARVIVMETGLILFDEPLSNLDHSLRLETRNEIKRLQREIGITSIYVTHDQSEALSLSDRIAVMNKGKILQTASPEGIYYSPSNKFVAGFIGHSNFFNKDEAKNIFDYEISNDDVISVLPEELLLKKSQTGKGKIIEVLFTGLVTEIILKVNGKIIKVNLKSDVTEKFFPGENADIILLKQEQRILKDEQ
jgi:iron(III) transport system ATP-binding protein